MVKAKIRPPKSDRATMEDATAERHTWGFTEKNRVN
jgi:hypothetical protein